MDLNQLKQYMDFYKANSGDRDYSAHNGFNPTPYNPDAAAFAWATRTMNEGAGRPGPAPNFFAGSGETGYSAPAYVEPKPYTVAPAQSSGPLSGQMTNYLSQFLSRGRR